MKIVRYGSNEDIDIEFLDEFHYIKEHQAYSNFKSGGVKNPYDRDLYNVGYLVLVIILQEITAKWHLLIKHGRE